MDIKIVEKMLEAFDRSGSSYLEYQEGDKRIVLKKDNFEERRAPISHLVKNEQDRSDHNNSENLDAENVKMVTSPIVGTVYCSKEPGAAPFVTIGQAVKKGDTLCLIEAMKMFSEVKSPCDGVVNEIYFTDGELAEFGSRLIAIGR